MVTFTAMSMIIILLLNGPMEYLGTSTSVRLIIR